MYFSKTPKIFSFLFSSLLWKKNDTCVYLTFDDGPHPNSTPQLLAILDKLQIKATFFCNGKNIALYPSLFNEIIENGHTVGIHGFEHQNAWKQNLKNFVADFEKSIDVFNANSSEALSFYRPPYGKIKFNQKRFVESKNIKIIMWTVMPGDFDIKSSNEKCLQRVLPYLNNGNIICLHDNPAFIDKTIYLINNSFDKNICYKRL